MEAKAEHRSVPVAIGATLVQSSLYDVPGGYRAVLFDRFSGVQPNVYPISKLPLVEYVI